MSEPILTPEQLQAAAADRGPAVVSAAAGSGKTRVLTERFVHLVCERGFRVEEIAAVTFTERAAGEMRRRVAGRFAELGLEAERRASQRSHISTIHGLASSILREHPALAGIDPRFVIIDETAKRLHTRRITREMLDRDEALAEVLTRRSADEVSGAARRLIDHERARGLGATDILATCDDPGEYLRRTLDALRERLSGMLSELGAIAAGIDPSALSGRTAEKAGRFVALVSEALASGAPLERDAIESIRECTMRATKSPGLSRAKALIDEHRRFVPDEGLERRLSSDRLAVTRLAGTILLAYGQLKASRGELDYEDLLILTRDLLRDHEFVRADYRSRFRALMVDEYQDTNPLQTEILEMLAPPERLFVVGDLRQSIYGFRNARPGIFREAERSAAEGRGRVHRLAGNFRSVAGVVDFVNEFFSRLPFGLADEPVRAERDESTFPASGAPAVEFIPVSAAPPEPAAEGEPPGPDRASRWAGSFAEAGALAERIRRLVESGAEVHDPATGRTRPAAWGDFGILVRTRGEAFRAIELAFSRAGIPLAAGGGTRFYRRREIADVLNLLAVVENPTRDYELAAVLRSPFVEISDDALVLAAAGRPRRSDRPSWRRRSPLYEGLVRAAGAGTLPEGDLERARAFLELRDRLGAPHLGAGEVIREAVRAASYDAKLLARGRGTRAAANVRKLVLAAERFDRSTGGGLRGFLEYAAELSLVERVEPAAGGSGDGSVRLLTMHGAKGLEFPVVAVADLGYDFLGTTERQRSYATDELGISLRAVDEYGLGARKAASQALARAMEVGKARAEEARLLYVAVTRARDRLILSGVVPGTAPKSPDSARTMLDWLRGVLGDAGAGSTVEVGRARVLVSAPREAGRGTTDRVIDLAGGALEGLGDVKVSRSDAGAAARAVKRMTRPAPSGLVPGSVQATALRDFESGVATYVARHVLGTEAAAEPDLPENATGTAFGLAVHRALEFADFSADPAAEAKRLARRCLKAGGLAPKELALARRQVERFLASETARRIERAEWAGREVSLAVTVGGTLLRGVADVVWREGPGKWSVIDYKTDAGDPSELAERYRMQLAVYALAVARSAAAGAGVMAAFAFLESGDLVEIGARPPELEAAIAEALRRLGEWEFAPRFADAAGPAPATPPAGTGG